MNELFKELIAEAQHCCMSDDEATLWGRNFLKKLSDAIADEFPDPNPLGSLFSPYIIEEVREFIERLGA